MSNRKRFLAMLLAVMMIVSTIATMGSVSANAFIDVEDEQLAQALGVLGDLGIVKGIGPDEDGNPQFGGEQGVTRQQFALFVARITSGTPEFLEAGAATIFEDVTDETYYAAINYCVEYGIVEGFPDGTFRPTEGVTMQQAIAMLVRALGYVEKNAAVIPWEGVLTHATRPEVRLIGRNVETDGFDLVELGKRAGDSLTRNDMAMLLYNFLLTDKYEVGAVYNEQLRRFEHLARYQPVLSAFGIERVVGYVVNVVNYSAEIYVKNYYRAGGTGSDEIFYPGADITRRMANPDLTSNPVDIRIRFSDPGYTIGIDQRLDVNRMSGNLMSTTKAALGIDEDYEGYEGDLDLLGKKITIYRNVVISARGAVPSAVVVGVKTDVTGADNTASFETATATVEVGGYAATERSVDFVTELVLGTPDDKVESFNQRVTFGIANAAQTRTYYGYSASDSITDAQRLNATKYYKDAQRDLSLRYHLYSINGNGLLRNSFENNDLMKEGGQVLKDGDFEENLGNNVERELAKILKGNDGADAKNYRLTYVDNGLDSLGNPEFYYVFTPLQIGYGHDDTSGTRVKFEMGRQGIDQENKANEPKTYELRAADDEEDAITPVKGEAYLFTAFGSEYKDITVYSKLDRLAKEVTLLSRAAGVLRFSEAAYPRVEFSFAVNASKATGAWQASDIGRSDDSLRTLRGKYDIFGDADGVALIAKRVEDAPADNRNFHTRFGVIRTTGTPSAILLADCTVAYMHRVYDVTDKIENNYMLVPATTADDADIFNNALTGAYIGLYNRTGSAYDAAVLVRPNAADNGGTLTDNRSRILGTGDNADRYSVLLKRADNPATTTGLIGNNITSAANTSIIRPDVPNRINLSNGTGLFTLGGTAATYTSTRLLGTAAAGTSTEAIFNSSTRFVVIGSNGVVRSADNLAQAGAIIGDNAIHSIAFVANGPGNVPGAASVVFFRSMNTLTDPAIVPRVGIIVDSDSNFFFADANQIGAWAFDYVSGTVVRVVTGGSAIGTLVRILNTEVEDIDGNKAFRTAALGTKTTGVNNKTPSNLLSNTGRYSGGDRLTAIREALVFNSLPGFILESVDSDGNHGTTTVSGKVQYYREGEAMTIQATDRVPSPTSLTPITVDLSRGTYKMLFVDDADRDNKKIDVNDPSTWTTANDAITWTKEGRTALSGSGVTGGLGSMSNTQFARATGDGRAVYAVVTFDNLTSEALAVTFIVAGVPEGDSGDLAHLATKN